MLPPRLKHLAPYVGIARESDWVYVIECQGFVKVGVAVNVPNRVGQLQTGCPFPLRLIGCWQVEDAISEEEAIHSYLDGYRVRGEWFKLPKAMLAALDLTTDPTTLPLILKARLSPNHKLCLNSGQSTTETL